MTEKIAKHEEGETVLMSEEVLIFILDCSGSMNDSMDRHSGYGQNTKMQAMKKALQKMMTDRMASSSNDTDQVGAVTIGWANSAGHGVETFFMPKKLTAQDVSRISLMQPEGGTPLEQGIKKGFSILDQTARGFGRLVVMSDGHPDSHKGGIIRFVGSMHEETGFVVDTIGIGRVGDSGGYDADFMRKLAEAGGGEFYEVTSAEEFSRRLSEMEAERRSLIGQGILMLPPPAET